MTRVETWQWEFLGFESAAEGKPVQLWFNALPDEQKKKFLLPYARGEKIGCFALTDEGCDDPVVHLAAARERLGVSAEAFQVLETGETRIFTDKG